MLRALALLGCLLLAPLGANAEPARVAGAASLSHALEALAERFAATGGERPKLTFGSSGTLARQMLRGAPFELFLSANERYAELLVARGVSDGPGAVYALGRLVLFVPSGSPAPLDAGLGALAECRRRGCLERLAIANPVHAPYGEIAREALESAGVWDELQGALVIGENAAQAAQFAATGAVDAALLPEALARVPALAARGRSVLLRPGLYTPLRQRMVLRAGAGAQARAFYAYLLAGEARATLATHGFAPAEADLAEAGAD